MDWGILEDEGTLTSAPPSTQEPLSSRAEGNESTRLAAVGAEESVASRGVPVEDQWVAGSEEVPGVLIEGGGSDAAPCELTEGGGSGAPPEVLTGRGGSAIAPSIMREVNSLAREREAASKRSRPDESGQGSGGLSPKRPYRPRALG